MIKRINNNSGITLLALVLTIIVMIIIASIAVYEGMEIIGKSKIQTYETNMLTIQAKARAYAEEIEAKIWALSDSKKETKRKNEFENRGLNQSETNALEYTVTDTGLEKMGLGELKGQVYKVIFSSDYKTIEVEYAGGIKYEGNTINTLSELQNALTSEPEEQNEANSEGN